MGGYEWTEEEKAFVVYYTFLGVRRDDIAELLNRRGFPRSGRAVSNMVASIQKNEGVAVTSMSRTEADALIHRLSSGYEIDCSLLPVDGDQEVVNRGVDVWTEYLAWLNRGIECDQFDELDID